MSGPRPQKPGLAPPTPIPLKDRAQLVFVERAQLDVRDGAFCSVNADGTVTQIPVGGLAGLMLEPGARISHAAVALAARTGTLITWVGEGGVRLYSAGQPGGARSDKLLWQARLALDEAARLRIVRKMFEIRFGEAAPERRSIDQLRGIEGVLVRESYALLAQKFGSRGADANMTPKTGRRVICPTAACPPPRPVCTA